MCFHSHFQTDRHRKKYLLFFFYPKSERRCRQRERGACPLPRQQVSVVDSWPGGIWPAPLVVTHTAGEAGTQAAPCQALPGNGWKGSVDLQPIRLEGKVGHCVPDFLVTPRNATMRTVRVPSLTEEQNRFSTISPVCPMDCSMQHLVLCCNSAAQHQMVDWMNGRKLMEDKVPEQRETALGQLCSDGSYKP